MYIQLSRMLPLSHFLCYPKQSTTGSVGPTIVTTRGNITEATVMGLLPFTNYDCYVTANTSVGEGPPSDTKTQRTVKNGGFELDDMLMHAVPCTLNV